jgi:cell division protein FtsW
MVLMALVPFLGFEAGGATRWFQIGPFNFQPSEFAKLAIIMFFSDYIAKNKRAGKGPIRQALPYLMVGIYMAVTLFLQPHISCIIIILALIFVLMIFGEVPKEVMFVLSGAAVLLVGLAILVSSHARGRILAWLHPEDFPDVAWQPIQSLYAIGSGGVWGVGLGQSTQKHLYLPEPQNDYIFSILCEELGFIFAIGVMALFVALIWRGIYIAKHAPSIYACLIVVGIVAQVGIQAFLNIAVVTNTIPSTGIPLPFFSYGGTSLVILMAEMGMVLNISRYSYIRKDK